MLCYAEIDKNIDIEKLRRKGKTTQLKTKKGGIIKFLKRIT